MSRTRDFDMGDRVLESTMFPSEFVGRERGGVEIERLVRRGSWRGSRPRKRRKIWC